MRAGGVNGGSWSWRSTACVLLIHCAYVCGQQPPDKTCQYLNHGPLTETNDKCFCYKTEWNLKKAWSTVRIFVHGTEAVAVSHHLQVNCIQPENIFVYFTCLLHTLWKPSVSKQVYLDVSSLDQDFCFNVKTFGEPTSYTVTSENIWFNPRLIALFLTGFLLFCFASTLSRTSAAFYGAGLTFGTVASPLLLLLILKKYISKSSTVWLLVSIFFFLTAYTLHFLKENIGWIWTDNKHYVLGYIVTVGLLSFVACYRHGALCSEWHFVLFTWTLKTIACFLIYFGLAIPRIAFAIIAVLVSCKGFCKFFHNVHRIIFRKKHVVKLLTEDEYIEQAEIATAKALEELRHFCNCPDFDSWLVVSKLSSPKRFAEFILGSSHVSPLEAAAHEEQYGLGSCFLAEQFFTQDREEQQDQDRHPLSEQNQMN